MTNNRKDLGAVYMSAAWGVIIIVIFAIAIGTDSNVPNSDSKEIFTHIVKTDRGSFLSGIAGPVYTIANFLGRKHAGVIIDDTWGQGNGRYKLGFVFGSILLVTGIGAISSLIAVIKSMMG